MSCVPCARVESRFEKVVCDNVLVPTVRAKKKGTNKRRAMRLMRKYLVEISSKATIFVFVFVPPLGVQKLGSENSSKNKGGCVTLSPSVIR